MKTFVLTLVASAALLLHVSNAMAADRVQPGDWETTLTMPNVKPMVSKHCITPAEAKLMNGDLPALRKYVEDSTAKNTRGRCVVRSVAVKGNQTTVAIACGKTEVVATTTYHGDRYESTSSNGTKIAGKRLGSCK
jgi:hypothetical protein